MEQNYQDSVGTEHDYCDNCQMYTAIKEIDDDGTYYTCPVCEGFWNGEVEYD
ncbi:hypothetical protein [Vagococcus fluvialis]|uniref:hypothetical protein n=1 Tax=Vagococcus fluvialis TaxID=2738 RepID=UPI001D09F73E|nr:hypothetical protein [Vagococcus fluvialis]UDM72696.1 hypothetical protein K5L00_15020 [Vagococcus fluvialis]UDM78419.1 hypothetical protein K5K98_14355 [Vagococcus fluvialis]UDM83971.1 hypothetical protein K5K96_15045 [Vagococcus fluvialis]